MPLPHPPLATPLSNKVPQATLVFWLLKMMSTTVGETAADFINQDLGLGLPGTAAAVGLLFAAALLWQLRAARYHPLRYWLTVLLVSVFGTLVTDMLTDLLGVPLWLSSGVFAAGLVAVFVAWYRTEGTLSIHAIDTPRREHFYWAAIFLTFALGTATGDWASEGLQLGYVHAAALFAALIAGVAVLHYLFRLNAVAAFWAAYVLTRPFGAACGDYLSQDMAAGGVGLGAATVNIVFLVSMLAIVFMLCLEAADAGKGGRRT